VAVDAVAADARRRWIPLRADLRQLLSGLHEIGGRRRRCGQGNSMQTGEVGGQVMNLCTAQAACDRP
jgi:hypothetical protein